MTEKPFFSIIIPVYNREETIERAIASCLNQTFVDFEILIINDKSTDKTESVIKSISDTRIKYFCNRLNMERCVSRNNGIMHANGKFICFLDSDDYFLSNHLSTFYNKIQKSNIQTAFLFSNNYIENEGAMKHKNIAPKINEFNTFEYLLKHTPNPARVCISTTILHSFNFDVNLPGLEDLDLWLRIAVKHSIIQLTDRTSVYCVHSNSYSDGDPMRYEKELRYHKIIKNKPELRDNLPQKSINRLSSMCHFHLAKNCIEKNERIAFYKHAFKSFFLYREGYNGKTNRILFINALYFIPLLGSISKFFVALIKKQVK